MKLSNERIREIAEIKVTEIVSPRQELEDVIEDAIKQALSEQREATKSELDKKIRGLEAVKIKHKQSKSCEFPRTCGACHFYSGSIELAKQLKNE